MILIGAPISLSLVGAAAATLLAASGYAFTWVKIADASAVSGTDVLLSVLCILTSVFLFAAGLHVSGARDPWLGGLYITALTVLTGIWSIVFLGTASVTPTTWMGAAACVAMIYAMDRGHPTKRTEAHEHVESANLQPSEVTPWSTPPSQ